MAESETHPPAPQPDRLGRGLRVLALAALLLGLVLLGRKAGSQVESFRTWVDSLGIWGPLVFVAGYAAAVVAFVPASALTLGAGAIFGLVRGTLYVFVAATLGSALAFLVSRHLARGRVERRLAGNRRFAAIDRAVGREGRKIVFLLRLSPVFPFNLLNYALGLTSVRFADYLVAALGMLPGTLAYVYLGKVGGDVAQATGAAESARSPVEWAILAVGLVATLAVAVLVARIARRALARETELDTA